MRALAIALASGLVLAAVPAIAQQSDSGGVGGIIRNLDNTLNNRNAPSRPYNSPADSYGSRDYGSDRYSGSSVPPGGYGDRGLRSSDAQAEQRRLDDAQAQINRAQQQLNEQYREFYQSQRGMSR
jgi:hypothetical protein